MPDGESERTVVICSSCGSAYAAKKWTDGTIQPIGRKAGCDCGAEDLHIVEDSEETSLRDGE